MSQAMYTSMSGINAAQTGIEVVANNVANLNTTAYKTADTRFQNLFSRTYTTGNSPTLVTGGKNPRQVGLGVKVGSIVRNMETGNYSATGRTSDLMISGGGYFTVRNSQGEVFLTRDGSFTLDAEGSMVNALGYKVMGASQLYNTSSSGIDIHVPRDFKSTIQGDNNVGSKKVKELNDANITAGDFKMEVMGSDGVTYDITINITDADLDNSVNNLIANIQGQITGLPAGVTVNVATGTDGSIQFIVSDTNYDAGDPAHNTEPQIAYKAGTSNFLESTRLASADREFDAGTKQSTYSSKILSYTVIAEPTASLTDTISLSSYSIAEDGTIEAAYSNGDKLTVEINQEDKTFQFKYTTSLGVIIRGDDVEVNPNVAREENLVLQLAKVTNDEGLVSLNGNLWQSGPNTGDMVFSTGGAMGIGTVLSGGLEASNVDLSRELANMILDQRAIQANSRVFSTASSILESLARLGL